MKMKLWTLKTWAWFVLLGIAPFAAADQSGLLQTNLDSLSPLQTLQITVYDVNDFCQITVPNPNGVVHTFSGTVQSNQATASYIPSYLPGTYEIYAQTTGPVPVTETDTVTVLDNFRSGFRHNLDGFRVRLVEGTVKDRSLVTETASANTTC